MKAGYQLVMSAHALADFAHQLPIFFNSWKENSNNLISLSTQNEQSLIEIYNKLKISGAPIIAFYEPDHHNQMTAICFYGTPQYRKMVSSLPLALKNCYKPEIKEYYTEDIEK